MRPAPGQKRRRDSEDDDVEVIEAGAYASWTSGLLRRRPRFQDAPVPLNFEAPDASDEDPWARKKKWSLPAKGKGQAKSKADD